MFSRDVRHLRHPNRTRRKGVDRTIEPLETRELMNYSPLGLSYPVLQVQGQAPAVAAYGAPITVSADLYNLGSSTVIEPTHLAPGNQGTSAAPASTVAVYISRNPRGLTPAAVKLGVIQAPAVPQGGVVEVSGTFEMPAQPRGYPGDGGAVYVYFVANAGGEANGVVRRNRADRADQPVLIAAPLPELVATALNVPTVMQPGDAVSAEVKVANYGTAATALQAPVIVELVASADQNFGPGDVVLAAVSISNIPPLSNVPASGVVLGDSTLDDPANVITAQFPTVALPTAPSTYYLGIEIDPANQIHEIHEVGRGQSAALQQVVTVGPAVANLPPATAVANPSPGLDLFAIPPYGILTAPYLPANPFEPVLIGLQPLLPVTGVPFDTGTGTAVVGPAAGLAGQAGVRAGRAAALHLRRRG